MIVRLLPDAIDLRSLSSLQQQPKNALAHQKLFIKSNLESCSKGLENEKKEIVIKYENSD